MKTFTIDAENNITVHTSRKAAKETGLPHFSNEDQFAELIGGDHKRYVEIWNSLPGVTPVKKFASRTVGAERIWKAIQSLNDGAPVAAESEAAASISSPSTLSIVCATLPSRRGPPPPVLVADPAPGVSVTPQRWGSLAPF